MYVYCVGVFSSPDSVNFDKMYNILETLFHGIYTIAHV